MAGPSSTDGDPGTRALSDRVQITELLLRLARAMDTRDFALLATCFTADAVGHFATGPATGIPAIQGQYEAFLTPLETTQHMISNTEVSLDGDTASTTSYFQAQHVRTLPEGPAQFLIGGTYTDEVVRTDRGWQIRARTVQAAWTSGDRRVIAATLEPQDRPEERTQPAP